MNMLEWSALGAIMFAIIIFCARLMRRGLTTLDDDRRIYLEKIRAGEQQIREDRKRLSSVDHLRVMKAALEDLLRLDGNPAGYSVQTKGRTLELVTPEGNWEICLIMREHNLQSTSRVLHGKSRWLLSGFGFHEQHNDPASLMRSLNTHLHSEKDSWEKLPQLERGAQRELTGEH